MVKHNYNQAFKEQAVQYYLDNKIWKEWKLPTDLVSLLVPLHKWVKRYQEAGYYGRGSGNYASDKDKEIAQLKRQLRDAKRAIEVLKKSIEILSKYQRKRFTN